jgi:cytochrome d ubiquinol oxidase subunit II
VIDATLLLGLVLVLSLTCYALLGGADYGGGVWDLLATGPTAERQRATIAHAIGPVWEANHVWLIVAIVVLFTGFPRAFSELSTFLHIPLLLVLVGIVMRGSAFVFRAYGADDPRHERFWGRVFAVASTATPLFLGVVVGSITEGRLPASATGTFAAVFVNPWITPFALAVGVFALSLFAFLAAVYLTLEADDDDERLAFRTRALASGVVVALLALIVLGLAPADLRRALLASPIALPLHVATGISAISAFWFLRFERYVLARVAVVAQVTLILWGWALTQYPYAIRPHLTLTQAAAPGNVQVMLLQVLGVGAVIVLPALLFLFGIFDPRGKASRHMEAKRSPRDES